MKTTRKLLVITTTFLVLNAPLVYLDFENFPNYIIVFIQELKFLVSPTKFPSELMNNNNAPNASSSAEEYSQANATLVWESIKKLSGGPPTVTLNDVIRFCSYPLYYLNFSINFLLYAFEPSMLSANFLITMLFKNGYGRRNSRSSGSRSAGGSRRHHHSATTLGSLN
jgi:hypothetical protein